MDPFDPNENLSDQKELAQAILDGTADQDDVELLAELVLSLAEHVEKGGALPDVWAPDAAEKPKKSKAKAKA